MASSTSHFDQPVTRSRFRSWWSAGHAVHADITQEDHLRRTSREYEAHYRRSHYPLPFTVAVMDGNLERIPNADYVPSWEQARDDPTDEETRELFESQSELEEITRDQEELEEEGAWLRAKELSILEQLDALEEEEFDGIGTGRMPGSTTMRRRARGRTRPRLPFPWLPVLGYTAIVAKILLESYQFALPFMDMIGVDTTRLGREWSVNPLGVVGGAGFAIAASVGLFFLWYLTLRCGSALSRSLDSAAPAQIVRQAAGLFFLCVFLLVGTYVLANLRHGMTTEVTGLMGGQQGIDHSVFLFLTLLVPFACAYLHYRIGQSACWQARRDSIAAQEQWEREAEVRLLPAETLTDRMHLILQRRALIDKARAQLRARRSVLARRAQAVQDQRLERLKQARDSTEAYVRTLLSALERDRYYFLRAAHKSKALHLVSAKAGEQSLAHQQPRHVVRALLSSARNGHRS